MTKKIKKNNHPVPSLKQSLLPLSVLRDASLNPDEIDTYQKAPVGDPDQGADFLKHIPMICELSGWVDHSGKGAFFLWKQAATKKISIRLNTDSSAASEIIFHSVWGSHWEDLEILKYMTGHDFQTRRKLADAFRGKGSTASALPITNIGIVKYAKLSQALPTSFTSGGSPQAWNKTVFAGKRKTPLSSLFSEHLTKMRTIPGGSGKTHNLYKESSEQDST